MEDRKSWIGKLPVFGALDDFRDAVSKMPSEDTLLRFLDALPRIERIVESETLAKVAKLDVLADALKGGALDRVVRMAPLLENIPREATLVDIANLKPYLSRIPTSQEIAHLSELLARIPSPAEMKKLTDLLEEVKGFLQVLKGR